MAFPAESDLKARVRHWIEQNSKETSRLEFKLKIELGTPGAKAEFIRDVIALANSEGEAPREDGHLVIGFKEGQPYKNKVEHYDGATFGQILDSYICPPLRYGYEKFNFAGQGRIGVLVIKPDTQVLYIVNRRLQDDNGRVLLSPGQCWGRKAGRKIELTGEEIQKRLCSIVNAHVKRAMRPLEEKINKLQEEGGPTFEVKRIRFEMEATSDWSALEGYLDKLVPYAREFDHVVKHEVLNAVMNVTGRTRQGMPLGVAQSVDNVLMEVMPVRGGGLNYPTREEITEEDQELLKRMENATFELTWDACRYLRDMKIVEVGARLYWVLIRISTLNRLERLQSQALNNARSCQNVCLEERMGKAFPEGHQKLGDEITHALDVFECEGYEIKTVPPSNLKPADLAACIAIIKTGEAVDWKSAKEELPAATAIAVARNDKQIVGIGAIKRERRGYAAGIAQKSGVAFPPETLELGYVAVSPSHRGHHLSHGIVRSLLRHYTGRLFATTYSKFMKSTLIRFGFVNKGREWKGRKEMLSFWEKDPSINN